MKKVVIFIVFIFTTVTFVNSQRPLTNDTIICIVDTTQSFTTYTDNPYKKAKNAHWNVAVKGHYYDDESPKDADFATIVFSTNFTDHSYVKGPKTIIIPVKGMEERFTVVTDKWLNEQKDLYKMGDFVGHHHFSKYNFLIFKQDLKSSKDGKVKAYRVLIGYNEIQN